MTMDAWVGLGIIGFVPAYVVLQAVALLRLRGGFRTKAARPLVPMGAVVAFTIFAFLEGSNLFPLMLILAAPIAFLYLVAVLIGPGRPGRSSLPR